MAYKLLLADDSITIQKVVSLTFAEEDFDVICVGNGELGIEKIREWNPDIVLADIFMPRKTGYEVCDFVKRSEHHRHMPVILLVGTFEPFDKSEASNVGADGFLTKPFETTALIKMVRQTLEKAKAAKVEAMLDRTVVASSVTGQVPLIPVPLRKPGEDTKTVQIPRESLLELPDLKIRSVIQTDLEETILGSSVPTMPDLQPDEILLPAEDEVLVGSENQPAAGKTEEVVLPEAEQSPVETVEEVVEEPAEETPEEVLEETPGETREAAPAPIFEDLPEVPTTPMPVETEFSPEDDEAEREAAGQELPVAETSMRISVSPQDSRDEVLEIRSIESRIVLPSEEDILGVFEIIGLEKIIAQRKTLDEALRQELLVREAAAKASPIVEAPPVVEAVAEAVEEEPVPAISVLTLPAPEETVEAVFEAPAPIGAEAPAIEPEPLPAPCEAAVEAAPAVVTLDETLVTRIARMVVERLTEKIIRDIAWEVVPELAELLIRQEIDKLKQEGRL